MSEGKERMLMDRRKGGKNEMNEYTDALDGSRMKGKRTSFYVCFSLSSAMIIFFSLPFIQNHSCCFWSVLNHLPLPPIAPAQHNNTLTAAYALFSVHHIYVCMCI